MPVSKQTQELTFSLRAILYRIRQLIKERQSYSKAKHRELAKLLRNGREEFARIKTEDVIANDDLIAALEILELHCEQLHVRANVLDHLAFAPGRPKRGTSSARARKAAVEARRRSGAAAGTAPAANTTRSGGWGLWKVFGFSGSGGSDSTSAAVPATKSQGVKDENQDPSHENALEEEEPEQDEVYIERELDKSAAVIFYAYPRIPRDIPGLPELRAKLALRWGSDFANRSQEDNPPVKIPKELADRLRVHRPSEELIEMYLREIARSHGIPWHQDEDENEEEGDDGGQVPDTEGNLPKASSGDAAALGDKGEAKGSSKAGSVSKDLGGEKASQPGAGKAKDRSGGIPDVDELTRRFAALKK